MDYTIREIQQEDNVILAKVIRSVLEEHGMNKPGTVYTDPTTDTLFELFQTPNSVYYVVEINDEIVGSNDAISIEKDDEAIEHLQKALLQLAVSDRELIIMHRLQEIKYEQIAEITGNSIGSIKVKMHRALKKLKGIYFQGIES